MVLRAAGDDNLAIHGIGNAAGHVVHFLPQRGIVQEAGAALGGEDNMDDDVGEGLRHRGRLVCPDDSRLRK